MFHIYGMAYIEIIITFNLEIVTLKETKKGETENNIFGC